MNIQDRRGSLTAEELRQKYNLDALTKDRKAIERSSETIVKLNNEQNNMIEAIILSLSDIELQDNISLWFYNRAPTLENEPSINWEDNETKTEHIGDLYYDRETGYVYQFNYNDELFSWDRRFEANLIQAMALTNAAVDIEDRERKVFLTLPFPPYDNGDWYIKDNGDLYICQISKTEEEVYNEYDFIIASKYALGTDAIETNNKIVIIAGQVTTIINSIGLIEQSIEDNKYYVDEEGVKHLISTATSTLKQDVSSIEAEVESIGNILTDFIKNVTHTGDYLMLPDTPRSGGAINTLSIKGFELKTKYKGMQPMSEYGVKGVLNFYTLIFDTVPTFDGEPNYVFVNSPLPLNKLGDVYDELLIESNKIKVIQRIGYDFTNEQWSVLSTPITHELNDVLLPTFDGDTFISVKYFDNLVYDAEYLVKNDLTSQFATQLESSAQFKINQDELNLKASKKDTEAELKILSDEIGLSVGKNDIISSINLSEEEIKIQAEKLKLEGLTTINNNFKVLLDGSIEAVNGRFSGDVIVGNTELVDKELGLLTTFIFPMKSDGFGSSNMIGWSTFSDKWSVGAGVIIPDNFEIITATLFLKGNKTEWHDASSSIGYGTAYNVKLKKDPINHYKLAMDSGFAALDYSTTNTNALGSNGVTVGGSSGTEHIVNIDKSYFSKGFNYFLVESDMSEPSTDQGRFLTQVMITAGIQVTGYVK